MAGLHGDKGVWKLSRAARSSGTIAELTRRRGGPLDVDTWDDYQRLLARRRRDGVRDVDDVMRRFDAHDYLLDEGTASAIYLAVALGRPLLLEGEPGVGKTTAAKTLAAVLDTPLIRLQCYEGLTAGEALYDWNYQRQLLASGWPRRMATADRRGRPVHRGVSGRPPDPAMRPVPGARPRRCS